MPTFDFVTAAWWAAAFDVAKQLKLTEYYGHGLMLQFELPDAPTGRAMFGVTVSSDGTNYDYQPGAPTPPAAGAPALLTRVLPEPLVLRSSFAVLKAIFTNAISGYEAYSRGLLVVTGDVETAGQLLTLVRTGRFANWREQVKTMTSDLG
jgi:hypothetical protein